jgi:hypothetical protein
MAIKSIEDSKTLKKYGELLGREKIALRIIELCKEVASQENYKEAIKAAGKLRALAMACKFDCYWEEKMSYGYFEEIQRAELELNQFENNGK